MSENKPYFHLICNRFYSLRGWGFSSSSAAGSYYSPSAGTGFGLARRYLSRVDVRVRFYGFCIKPYEKYFHY